MLAPRSSHLVERAAERLRQSGVLEDSAAHLLEPGHGGGSTVLPPRQPDPVPPPAGLDSLPANMLAPEPLAPAMLDQGSGVPSRAPASRSGVVLDMASLERAGLLDWTHGRTRISEEFRLAQRQILRTAFAQTADPGLSNLVMVTSARPGEGKSFTSLNLSCSVALQGDHRVLLVDSDSKRDSLCHALGLGDARGILDLVADPKLDPADVILQTEIDNFSVLPVGQERGRSSELFASREMTQLIQRLARRYSDRLLILDAAPCLSTSDPAALAPVVGQILFVVEAERTQRDEIEASLDLVQACPQIMMLLNKVQISTRYTFGAYSNYYSS